MSAIVTAPSASGGPSPSLTLTLPMSRTVTFCDSVFTDQGREETLAAFDTGRELEEKLKLRDAEDFIEREDNASSLTWRDDSTLRMPPIKSPYACLKKDEDTEEEEFNSDDEYSTDLENEEGEVKRDFDDVLVSRARDRYTEACETHGVVPSAKVIEKLGKKIMDLSHHNLGVMGTQALADALKKLPLIEELDLMGNAMEGEGGIAMLRMLKENGTIHTVNLAKNNLSSLGAHGVYEMLSQNTWLTKLNVSDNNFRDTDAHLFAMGIERNDVLIELDLSFNHFSEAGLAYIGNAIGQNVSIQSLNLGWNQIRRKGAVSLCQGLKVNYTLTSIDMQWNGFGYEGSLAISEVIRHNHYIKELNIANNRINWDCAQLIAKALKENTVLEVLKIGHNPLTTTGCMDLIGSLEEQTSVVRFLGLDGIPVTRKVIFAAENIRELRPFEITYGCILDGEDVFGRRKVLRYDPLQMLIMFLNRNGIRLVDLFRTFLRDDKQKVSRDQFIRGLHKAKVPLDDYEIERLLNRLDTNHEGYVSYQLLIKSVKKHIENSREEERRKKREEKKERDKVSRILETTTQQLLPPIPSNNYSPNALLAESPSISSDSRLVPGSSSKSSFAEPRTHSGSRTGTSFRMNGNLPRISMSTSLAAMGTMSLSTGSLKMKKKKKKKKKKN